MSLITNQTKESLEAELARVTNNDAGVAVAVDQAREIVATLQADLGMSEEDAKKAVLGAIQHSAEEDGATLEDVYASYPLALKEYLQYSPADLKNNQLVTVAGTTVSAVLFLASFAFGVLAVLRAVRIGTAALPALIKMLRNPRGQGQLSNALKIIQIEVGRKVAVLGVSMGFTSALGWLASTAVNNWNDVFHWGPSQAESQAADIFKQIKNGNIGADGGSGTGAYGEDFVPTVSKSKTAKHKMFIGTILGGRVAEVTPFERDSDDTIDDEEEMLSQANNELVKWLKAMPGRLTYELQLKDSPFDEHNVIQPGIWVSLDLYFNGKYANRTFIDSILLGKVDPVKYMPDMSQTETLRTRLGSDVLVSDLKPVTTPDGGLKTVTEDGNIIDVPVRTSSSAPAPTKTTPQASERSEPKKMYTEATTAPDGSPLGVPVKQADGSYVIYVRKPTSSAPKQTTTPAVETEAGVSAGDFIPELGVRKNQIVLTDTPGSVLNVRASAGTSARVMTQLPHETRVTATGESERRDGMLWGMIKYSYRNTSGNGWVAWDYIKAT